MSRGNIKCVGRRKAEDEITSRRYNRIFIQEDVKDSYRLQELAKENNLDALII